MAQPAKKILKQALLLADKDRAELVAELLDSLPPLGKAESPSDEEWIAEVEQRARAALAGSTGLPWEQARAEVTERLERK
jgi:putative addiction module component (TIGR02574 family)